MLWRVIGNLSGSEVGASDSSLHAELVPSPAHIWRLRPAVALQQCLHPPS